MKSFGNEKQKWMLKCNCKWSISWTQDKKTLQPLTFLFSPNWPLWLKKLLIITALGCWSEGKNTFATTEPTLLDNSPNSTAFLASTSTCAHVPNRRRGIRARGLSHEEENVTHQCLTKQPQLIFPSVQKTHLCIFYVEDNKDQTQNFVLPSHLCQNISAISC